jgi:hypothetical protein
MSAEKKPTPPQRAKKRSGKSSIATPHPSAPAADAYASRRELYMILRANKFEPDPNFVAAVDRLEGTAGLPTFTLDHLVAIYTVWHYRQGIIDDLFFLAAHLPKGTGSKHYASALVAHCRMYREWFAEQKENRAAEFMAEVTRLCAPMVQEALIIEGRWDVLFQVWCSRPDVFTRKADRMPTEALHAGATWAGSLLDHLSQQPLPVPFLGASGLTEKELTWLLHLMDGGPLATLPYLPFTLSLDSPEAFGKLAPGAFGLGVSALLLLAELIVGGAMPGYAHRIVRMLAHDLKGLDRITIGRQLAHINYPAQGLIRLGDFLRWKAWKRQAVDLETLSAEGIETMVNEWCKTLWGESTRIKGVIQKPDLKEYKKTCEGIQYRIKPILRGRELFKEGRTHQQGIFAHLPELMERRLLVYSLRSVKGDNVRPLLTIELKGPDTMLNRFLLRNGKFPEDLQVMQVRGFQDRSATKEEAAVIQEWMRINKLKGTVRVPEARPTR